MDTLLKRSMPLLTPNATMPTVIARNTRWQRTGIQVLEMNVPKVPFTSSGATVVNSSLQAFTRKSSDQPPTTE